MDKLTPNDGASPDIVAENIERLREIFPEVFADGHIDFDALRQTLGDYVDGRDERYSFTWHGKSQARRIAQLPSSGTLLPCPEESVSWETTKNIFIGGDNLEVLKLLQKSYHRKVKLIYIDPPYNTGKEFIYPDKWQDNLDTYLRYTGQADNEGFKVSANTETSGRYHTNWLNMMYPRLKLARNLLADDGILIVSIDENEHKNLVTLCDEIFGEENRGGEIVWKNSSKNDQRYISVQHEYLLVYVKNPDVNGGEWLERKEGLEEIYKAFETFEAEHGDDRDAIHAAAVMWFKQFPASHPISSSKHYSWMDKRGVYFPSDISGPNYGQYRYDVKHPVTGQVCKEPSSGWRYPESTMMEKISDGLVHFGKDHLTVPCNKTYLKDTESQSVTSVKVLDGRGASNRLKEIFGGTKVFTNPKDERLLADLFKAFGLQEDDLVLDFFAGSGTTAHAVALVNAENGSRSRTILVQLPEDLHALQARASGSSKQVAGNAIKYLQERGRAQNIAEIGKERCRLIKVTPNTTPPGFRAFRLSSSNIKPWDADFEELDGALLGAIDNIKSERSEQDVLYELLLKYGLDLAIPVDERNIADKTVFIIGAGALVVCLDSGVTLDVVRGIAELKTELKPEVMRVVFKDSGFENDVVKTNTVQILKQAGVDDVKSL